MVDSLPWWVVMPLAAAVWTAVSVLTALVFVAVRWIASRTAGTGPWRDEEWVELWGGPCDGLSVFLTDLDSQDFMTMRVRTDDKAFTARFLYRYDRAPGCFTHDGLSVFRHTRTTMPDDHMAEGLRHAFEPEEPV